MLPRQSGVSEKDRGGGGGGGGEEHAPERRRAGGGRDRLVLWLAVAAVVQLCALAAGGAWVLLRLRALEESHVSLRLECAAAAAQGGRRRASGSDSLDLGAGEVGGARGTLDGSEAVSDEKRMVWRRFIRSSPSPPAAGADEASESHSGQPTVDGRWGGVAHFELSNSSVNPGDFTLNEMLSAETRSTVMTMKADHPYGGRGSDRWYPRSNLYYAEAERALMYLGKASGLEDLPSAAQVGGLGEIKVSQDGVYLIYAQICFMDHYPDFGFTIKKTSPGSVISSRVASCELFAGHRSDPRHRPPNTCSLTTVHRLTTDDSLSIRLTQARLFNLRPDLTFIGLVRVA